MKKQTKSQTQTTVRCLPEGGGVSKGHRGEIYGDRRCFDFEWWAHNAICNYISWKCTLETSIMLSTNVIPVNTITNKMRRLSWFIWEDTVKYPHKRKQEEQIQEGVEWLQDGNKVQSYVRSQTKKSTSFWKRQEKEMFPQDLHIEQSPADNLILALLDPFWCLTFTTLTK